MNGKKKTKPYFHNKWQAYKDAPSEMFDPCTWEEFMIFKLNGWDLPSSVTCIIRAEHNETGAITEHVYRQPKSAQKKLIKYLSEGEHTLTVCNADEIHLLSSKLIDDTDED